MDLRCKLAREGIKRLPIPKNNVGRFGMIEESGRGFVLAALMAKSKKSIWVIEEDARARRTLENEITGWGLNVLAIPEKHEDSEENGELGEGEDAAAWQSALTALAEGHRNEIILLSPASYEAQVPEKTGVTRGGIELKQGMELEPEAIEGRLVKAGFERAHRVSERGQFARRGGILDVFPLGSESPLRLDFFDTELESLREFDVETQVMVKKLPQAKLILDFPKETARLKDWRAKQEISVCFNRSIEADVLLLTEPVEQSAFEVLAVPFHGLEAGDFVMHDFQRDAILQKITDWLKEGWTVALTSTHQGEKERFGELAGNDFLKKKNLEWWDVMVPRGFVSPEARLAVVSLSELFGRYETPRKKRKSEALEQSRQAHLSSPEELNEGDLVVHMEYGIGRYVGLEPDDEGYEEIVLDYRDHAQLRIPISQAHLIARYIGVGGRAPVLSKLGTDLWKKTREKTHDAIRDYAARLLRLQAERESIGGRGHPTDSRWMWEFENSFPYQETPDQLRAIEDAKQDMEAQTPMDRLICGDVGFGKTEVAIRAAFKAVTGGTQAAILVPTTVLAEQHWRTFTQRMSEFPIKVALLNRFRTPAQQNATIEGLASGSVDIVIGTHRLLSKDIQFQNLGLVVIDEEQRFGVKHKEIFKERFRQIDVLTLSATPIPRTLYFSMMGVRNMSTIETAPPNRVPVKTSIHPYDERLIREAVSREIERGGQVFFLHNRVKSIAGVKKRIEGLVPGCRVAVGHGQMPREELEEIMSQFVTGKADVLLATTIIESGIDIPNANTIIIDRADRFGLADLYQLRGRVGRSDRQAYAILLLPRDLVTGGDSRKRLGAIKQYSTLGSGFRIAMRDLEIRGAGSLLGTKQSGHMAAIGFDLYCQLLKMSVEELSGRKAPKRQPVVRVDFLSFTEGAGRKGKAGAFLPSSYIEDSRERVAAYRALANVQNAAALSQLEREWRDRYGRLPEPIGNLLLVAKIRIEVTRAGADLVEIKKERLMIQRGGGYLKVDGNRFPRLTATTVNKKLQEAVELLEKLPSNT